MQNITDRACPICKSENKKIFLNARNLDKTELDYSDLICTSLSHGSHYQIVKCTNCDLKYCSPLIEQHDLNHLYSMLEDENYDYLELGRIITAQKALKNISKQHQKSLLDVGCNTGIFLNQAKLFGYQCFGAEPNLKAREKAKSTYRLTVKESLDDYQRTFDIITLWDVIEHVYSPLELCISINTKLNNGGEFHLSTMNVESLFAKLLGKSWPWYMPMHIQYFSKATITKLLISAGFKKVRIIPYIHHPSIFYLIGKILVGKNRKKLANRLLKINRPVIPFYLGDMMHVIAYK